MPQLVEKIYLMLLERHIFGRRERREREKERGREGGKKNRGKKEGENKFGKTKCEKERERKREINKLPNFHLITLEEHQSRFFMSLKIFTSKSSVN